MTTPGRLIEQYKRSDRFIQERKKTFQPRELTVAIYNPDTANLKDNINMSANPTKVQNIMSQDQSPAEINALVKNKFSMAQIAISKSLKEQEGFNITQIKELVDSKEKQKEFIDELDKTTEAAISGAMVVIVQYQQQVLEKVLKPGGAENFQTIASEILTNAVKIAVDQALDRINSKKDSLVKQFQESVKQQPRLTQAVIEDKNLPVRHFEKKSHSKGKSEQEIVQTKAASMNVSSPESAPKDLNISAEEKTDLKETLVEERVAQARVSDILRMNKAYAVQQTLNTVDWYSNTIPLEERPEGGRPLSEEYSNMLFRLFIWRDMIEEFFHQKIFPVFGLNWGQPQRSVSLEILYQASGEWMRDGWITPHNSYIHLIYRGGIVGAGIVFGIFFTLFSLTRKFLRIKSVTGIFLTSVLAYWCMMANSLVFLELPYEAIPFWCFFGMTLGYCQSQVDPQRT